MGLQPGAKLLDMEISHVFIGAVPIRVSKTLEQLQLT